MISSFSYNDGTPIEFARCSVSSLAGFRRLDVFPQPNEGYWKMGEVTYRDEVVIYRVLTDSSLGPKILRTQGGISETRQEEI